MKERAYKFEEGEILVFDKPLHWTSFNLVKIIRNNLSRRMGIKRLKVGHAGTLDPLASGVMIICTGRCTKDIDQLQAGTKEYVATMRLGRTTPSFDAEHSVDHTYSTGHISRALVDETLKRFLGSIWQVPPVYSACKVEGRRAFDYARNGEEVELKAKELVIDEIEVLDFVSQQEAQQRGAKPELTLRVVCSKGTYIRALARDIGEALGSGAYLTALRRTRVGQYSLADCHIPVEQVEQWAKEVEIERVEKDSPQPSL